MPYIPYTEEDQAAMVIGKKVCQIANNLFQEHMCFAYLAQDPIEEPEYSTTAFHTTRLQEGITALHKAVEDYRDALAKAGVNI